MNARRIGLGATGAALVGLGAWIALRAPTPLAVAPAPSSSSSTSSSPSSSSSPPPPSLATDADAFSCRHAVARGAAFSDVSDATLASAILDGFDEHSERVVVTKGGEEPMLPRYERDCRGDRVAFWKPLLDEDAGDSFDEDASTARGRVRVERFDKLGARMAVFVVVSESMGVWLSCSGFEALVRLDADAIVVEGVAPSGRWACADHGRALVLASLGDRTAILLPVVTSYGEDRDARGVWDVAIADDAHGLVHVGDVPQVLSAGNGTMSSGAWFGALKTAIDRSASDSGVIRIDETWSFERYAPDGSAIQGGVRHVMRSYSLVDGGLVRSPTTDPTR